MPDAFSKARSRVTCRLCLPVMLPTRFEFVINLKTTKALDLRTEAVVRASPDGYTLLYVTTANASNATLYDKLNFNFVRDIAPIAPIVSFPYIMEVNPSVPAKTLPEFIAYAKANPGKINMASPGIGSTPHVNGELFKCAPLPP
jgi:Tripartite tricarboxylate transporter family receptor